MECKLNSFKIYELCETVTKKLHEDGFDGMCELSLTVDKSLMKKIDEDLYYRANPDGKDFTPSDKELKITFNNLTTIIKAAD